jgi:hypothetical protein
MRTWQLLYWMSAGGLIGFGLIGILSIGFPFLLVGLGMVIYGAVRRWIDTFWAAFVGFGILPALFLMYDIITTPPPCPPQGLSLPPHATSVSCGSIPGSYSVLLVIFGVIALAGGIWPLIRRFRTRN